MNAVRACAPGLVAMCLQRVRMFDSEGCPNDKLKTFVSDQTQWLLSSDGNSSVCFGGILRHLTLQLAANS